MWLQTKRGYLHGIGKLGAEHDGLDSGVDSTDGSWLRGVDVSSWPITGGSTEKKQFTDVKLVKQNH